MGDDGYSYPPPTQWLGKEDDNFIGVVDYDGESLKVTYRKPKVSPGNRDPYLAINYEGEGPVILEPSEAILFAYKILDLIERMEEKA